MGVGHMLTVDLFSIFGLDFTLLSKVLFKPNALEFLVANYRLALSRAYIVYIVFIAY